MDIAITLALLAGGACCVIAAGKGRNPVGWLVLGTLLPLIGLIVVVMLPSIGVPASQVVAAPLPAGSYGPHTAQQHLQTTTMDALDRLAVLKERGVITALEYDSNRAELLARL
jgi:hypothetical protein